MSVHALSWAKRQKTGSPTRKLVLMTLADYAGDNGRAWPAQTTIATECELHERSIRRALNELEGLGYIRRYKRSPRPDGTLQTDIITLNLEATGHSDRRTNCPAPDFDDTPADTVTGKPSKNIPYQGRSNLSGCSSDHDDDGDEL